MDVTQTYDPVTHIEDLGPPPKGFRFAGIHAGIKRTRLDLGAIVVDGPATAAGAFTRNPVRAPCVDRNRALVPCHAVRAVVVNSGNANAMNGAAGIAANEAMAKATAEALGVSEDTVATLSTGVIGVPLNVEVVAKAIPALIDAATDDRTGISDFAQAILTTDTCTKVAYLEVLLPGAASPVRLLGIAKGSGMIHPNMATTLGFVCTDAAVSPTALQAMVREHIETTFNAISVDGDTSTNDSFIALASGASGVFAEGDAATVFSQALAAVMRALAVEVARDGEGATRLLEVTVRGAPDDASARTIAKGCCRSSLFKCSVFAGKPDWGRIAAAAGQACLDAHCTVTPASISIRAQGVDLVEAGRPVPLPPSVGLERLLAADTVRWEVAVGDGPGTGRAWGCDLSYDYVRINADEAAQVEVQPGGTVARNISLAAYSPRLKQQLLVDGLAYVRRFAGLRALVYARGAVVERFDLTASLAQDLALCLDAGLRVLMVLPEGPVVDLVAAAVEDLGHHVVRANGEPVEIAEAMSRGHLCLLPEQAPDPGPVVDLAIAVGIQKLIVIGDDQGLFDATGIVEQLSPDTLLQGLKRGRFSSRDPEFPVFARHAAVRGVPAVHLIDGRMPHALVGELFTQHGIGTLVTRQVVS
ncbi:MAG: bifunctional glutamate N-acetyltransferase/amino-acid acetyltransferase ArgJ [Deltaproteobacteria bacterium]|nr:MAG: bifunctional glutamate N-acetyltransferase/amino-acid acetyltransferase ArgJ [Deltaproteobacteria bacterium]